MQALCDPATHPNKVRISGPTFSGSFYSLAGLILQDKAKQPGKTYQIRSGTTQSQGAAQNFVNLVESPLRRDVEFHSATENLLGPGSPISRRPGSTAHPPGSGSRAVGRRIDVRQGGLPRMVSHRAARNAEPRIPAPGHSRLPLSTRYLAPARLLPASGPGLEIGQRAHAQFGFHAERRRRRRGQRPHLLPDSNAPFPERRDQRDHPRHPPATISGWWR